MPSSHNPLSSPPLSSPDKVICVTGEDTPDADVIVRVLLRCNLPMPLTLTNLLPLLQADGAEDDVVFAPSSKIVLMPKSTKVVDINVRAQGRALGAVLEVKGVTAEAGKNCKLSWCVQRTWATALPPAARRCPH